MPDINMAAMQACLKQWGWWSLKAGKVKTGQGYASARRDGVFVAVDGRSPHDALQRLFRFVSARERGGARVPIGVGGEDVI